MSSAVVPPRAASEALTIDPATVARFGADLDALAPGGRVLVAVSGGADSVALLLLMRAFAPERCVAATVDHGLRPESASEAAFVAALCATLDVDHAILSGPLPNRVGGTLNLSSRARVLRNSLLRRHREMVGAAWLATAHHGDDQLETMVMRLNRGAGLAGLNGVRRSTGATVRPLLGWRRRDLAAIVAAAGIEPVDDPTNRDDRFDRARLRKALSDADWLVPERWGQTAAALDEADAAIDWAVDCLIPDRIAADGDAVTLRIDDLPREIIRRLVVHCLLEIDPRIDLRGPAVTRLIDAIGVGDHATLGRVLVSPDRRASGLIRFTLAPPRRSR